LWESKANRYISAEDKSRIVLEGLRGETNLQELCRREGIATNQYYTWFKEFLEAGKQRLMGDTARQGGQPRSNRTALGNRATQTVGSRAASENPGFEKKLAGLGEPVGKQ
jgi:transposase-like protein